jgi:hypothetical protein
MEVLQQAPTIYKYDVCNGVPLPGDGVPLPGDSRISITF